MLVLNISVREAEWLKGNLLGCRDMAQEFLDEAGDDKEEVVIRNDEIKTLDHIIEEGLDDNWVRRGEFIERILGQVWEEYLEAWGMPGNLEEIMDEMDMSMEEMEEVFNSLGYTRD